MIKQKLPTKLQIIFAVLALLWMAIIFRFSAQPGVESHEVSQMVVALVTKVIGWLNAIGCKIALENIDMGLLDYIIRKIAHMTEYAVLGALLTGSLVTGTAKKSEIAMVEVEASTEAKSRRKRILAAIVLGILYAASDEFHQYFVPGRLGCVRDVCIDSVGVLIGVAVFTVCIKLICRKALIE